MSVFSHVVHNHANQGESNGIYMMVIMYNSFAITVLAEAKCNNCNVDVANLTYYTFSTAISRPSTPFVAHLVSYWAAKPTFQTFQLFYAIIKLF